MSRKTSIIGLILIALMGTWLKYYFSDLMVIKRNLTKLAVAISKEEQETSMQMALKMKKVKHHLTNPCQVIIATRNTMVPLESDLIIRYLMYYRQRYTNITLTLDPIEVDIPQKDRATVHTTIHLRREGQTSQTTIQETEPLEFSMIKADKTWRIEQVIIPATIVD